LEGLGKKLPGESEEIETGIEIRRESEKIIVRAGSLVFGCFWIDRFYYLYDCPLVM